jgi:Holliday junction resolvase RusA-like endonuclease
VTLPYTETPAAASLVAAAGTPLETGRPSSTLQDAGRSPRPDGDASAGRSLRGSSDRTTPAEAEPILVVIAHGTPGPQGSKNAWADKGGNVRVRESSKKVKPWRRGVREAAELAVPADWQLLDEPIELEMVFTLRKPTSAPKRRRTWPAVYPDLSKLARSTEDALTGVVWKDDARIVRYRNLAKTYPLEGVDALTYPGVVVRVFRLEDQ